MKKGGGEDGFLLYHPSFFGLLEIASGASRVSLTKK